MSNKMKSKDQKEKKNIRKFVKKSKFKHVKKN